jgi:hypothetical protein
MGPSQNRNLRRFCFVGEISSQKVNICGKVLQNNEYARTYSGLWVEPYVHFSVFGEFKKLAFRKGVFDSDPRAFLHEAC